MEDERCRAHAHLIDASMDTNTPMQHYPVSLLLPLEAWGEDLTEWGVCRTVGALALTSAAMLKSGSSLAMSGATWNSVGRQAGRVGEDDER